MTGLLTALAAIHGWATPTDLMVLFNDGGFEVVVNKSHAEIERARGSRIFAEAAYAGLLASRALIQLGRYEDAEKMSNAAVVDAQKAKMNTELLASLLFAQAHLHRVRNDFQSASSRSRDALALAPKNRQVELEYHLTIGRILFSAGYDVAAIVWLEKAETMSRLTPKSALRLEVLRFLSLAWKSKFYYSKAISYSQELVDTSENTEFKFRHRQGLYEYANLLSAAGQENNARALYKKGLNLAMSRKDDTQSRIFLSTLLLSSLYRNDIRSAETHLRLLCDLDKSNEFQLEILLGKAIIAALNGQSKDAETYFSQIQNLDSYSKQLIPHWRATIAERKHDWTRLVEYGDVLLKLSEDNNFRENLPHFYLMLAKGHWGLGNKEQAINFARKAVAIIDPARSAENATLSLSMLETFHSVYRLLAEIEADSNNIMSSFEIADYLKGRVLSDRINLSPLKQIPDISPDIRERTHALSVEFLNGVAGSKLEDFERGLTTAISERPKQPTLHGLANIEGLDDTAIVSYLFTPDGSLGAYVLEKGVLVRFVKLAITDDEATEMADKARRKIQNRIFFKSDGKEIYDHLIAPLSLNTLNLIIVPDKSLWKIPFQALSPDEKSYLIEKTTISYSASVSMLFDALKEKTPVRKDAGIFANDTFQNRSLRFVNQEAATIGKLFGTQPIIGATPQQFINVSQSSDILHFSMHAQADAEEPLDSYLAFKASRTNDGRITVADLLKIRLKHQSLVFLASCNTSNVLNGEGLVSIAWAMLGSGSTSVISSQWEANDKSTEMFAEQFYREYKHGVSASKAMQAASIGMIRNKSSDTHEPYYWAAFTLLGDFR